MSSALPSKTRSGPRLVLQPASRRAARHTSSSALKRFFAIADAWELSPLQQCRLLKIPSPQVLERYRLGQAPRLSATQQERAALIANIQYSLTAEPGPKDRAWAWVHAPSPRPPLFSLHFCIRIPPNWTAWSVAWKIWSTQFLPVSACY